VKTIKLKPLIPSFRTYFLLFGEHPRELISSEIGLKTIETFCILRRGENTRTASFKASAARQLRNVNEKSGFLELETDLFPMSVRSDGQGVGEEDVEKLEEIIIPKLQIH
jgi:hypothetical protein